MNSPPAQPGPCQIAPRSVAGRMLRLRSLFLVLAASAPLIGLAAYRARGYQVSTSDFDNFYQTVRQGLFESAHPTMSPDWGVFNYHPFFMVLMGPIGLLPAWLSCAIFLLTSIGLAWLAAAAALREMLPDSLDDRRVIGLCSLAMVSPFLVNSVLLGQLECLVLAALLLAWVQLARGRQLSAGLLVALATLLKAFPGLLVVWLLLKRRFRAVGGFLLGLAIGAGLLPSLLFGPAENLRLHHQWLQRVVIHRSALRELVKSEDFMWRYNLEGLPIIVRRYLTPQRFSEYQPGVTINFADLSNAKLSLGPVQLTAVQLIYLAVSGAGLLLSCWLLRHPWEVLPAGRRRSEFAFIVLAALLASPIIWAARYFALAWPACAMLCLHLRQAHRIGRPDWPAIAVAAVWIASLVIWTERLRACGVHFWAAVVLAVWVGVTAARIRPLPATAPPTGDANREPAESH